MKTETAFNAMERMGFQAGTSGEDEFLHGLDFLKAQIRAHPHFFVSANVLDAATGKPLAQPFVIRTYPARPGHRALRVAITGCLSGDSARMAALYLRGDTARVRITDAAAAMQQIVPQMRQRADVVVVLAHTDMQDASSLASAVPGIDLVVVGHAAGIYLNEAPLVNGAMLVANGDRARYAAQALLTLKPGGGTTVTVRSTPLSDALPENGAVALLRDAYKARLAAAGGGAITAQEMTPTAAFFPATGDNRYVGSAACMACHAKAYAVWQKSLHTAALRTLETTKKGINAKRPDCVRCHTVGFGQATGFSITAPNRDLAGVGCESCHGPGQQHVARAMSGTASPGAITRNVFTGNRTLCVRCHDPSNDPKFDFDKAIERIRHWGPGFART